jgi:hypothetical protein
VRRVAGGAGPRVQGMCSTWGAVVAVVLFVTGCGSSTNEDRANRFQDKVRTAETETFATSPAAAASTLAEIKTPVRFSRLPNCPERRGTNAITQCYLRNHSIVLGNRTMTRLVEQFGAKPLQETTQCVGLRWRQVSPSLRRQGCISMAMLGGDRVEISATSIVMFIHGTAISSTRRLGAQPGGTTVAVSVIGQLKRSS